MTGSRTAAPGPGPDIGVPDIGVIVAAFEAEDTIGTAIASALAQPDVMEVVVVDDASGDATAHAARAADDGSGRLRVIELAANRGPAGARNAALAAASAPYLAILDADDRFLPDRFATLPRASGAAPPRASGGGEPASGEEAAWDFFADNVVFLPHCDHPVPDLPVAPHASHGDDGDAKGSEPLTFEAFVLGNISRRDAPRGELGFMKPVIRRAFLERHALTYDETLRLGEDYALYARSFLLGARFRTSRATGYAAVMRPQSLSGTHSTADLGALAAADEALLRMPGITAGQRALLRRHRAHVKGKHDLRLFLDRKRARGLSGACADALARPATWAPIALGVIADKLSAPPEPMPGTHTLFPLPATGAPK